MKIRFKNIIIDHIGYTIEVKDVLKYPKNNWTMYVKKIDLSKCILYTKKDIKMEEFSTLAHEVLHILQYIAEARNIDLIYEQENMGYMMQYILNELLGLKYE